MHARSSCLFSTSNYTQLATRHAMLQDVKATYFNTYSIKTINIRTGWGFDVLTVYQMLSAELEIQNEWHT